MIKSPIRFIPINLDRDASICIQFRVDSFVCSFGNADQFYQSNGAGVAEYLDWLKKIIKENPLSAIHVWEGEHIIGQLELNVRKDESQQEFGYVNLFYLIPEKRGTGIADILNDYVEQYYRRMGISKMHLSVSTENSRAIGFYLKHGWKDIGPRSDFPGTHLMEKKL
jgi:ribosomal protein S18 acetylase RimI-like enzyme